MASGSCPCGSIRFDAQLPSKWVAHCHCTLCRRYHGAPYATWVGMHADRVAIHGDTLRWHASTSYGERAHCTTCGAPLFFRGDKFPGELHIALPHFTDPVDRAPDTHAWWSEHVDWASIDPNDGLKREG